MVYRQMVMVYKGCMVSPARSGSEHRTADWPPYIYSTNALIDDDPPGTLGAFAHGVVTAACMAV
jgi:hypothetical protein